MNLIDIITEIVDNNSGGVKLTQLLVTMVSEPRYSLMVNANTDELIDSIEWQVHKSKYLDILDYVHIQEESSTFRAKQFIYRKIPE